MVGGSTQLTGTGVGVGTPAYMSPEQGQGLKVDARTDIYALGVILFQMLTGQVPYEAETPMAVVIKHVTDPIPIPRQVNPNISEAVERVLLKTLAKERDDRFSSAGDMAAALRKAVQGLEPGVAATPIPPDPDATMDRRVNLPVAPPAAPPIPPPSPPLPAASPVQQKSASWLPIVTGIGVAAVIGLCGLAGLFYFFRSDDGSATPQSASSVDADTPVAPLPVTATSQSTTPTTSPTIAATDTPASSDTSLPQPTNTPSPDPTDSSVSQTDTLPTPTDTPTPLPTDTPPPPTSTLLPTDTPPPPTYTPTHAPSWSDTGLRPYGRYADIWTELNAGSGELGYPLADPVGDRLCARENFERGYMVWFDSPQEPQPVWAAVMPNRAANSGDKSYKFGDKWPGSPEYWCSDAEARAPLGPKRGFGMLWCIYPDLKADIGYALDEEVGGPTYPRCAAQLFQGGAIVHNPIDPQYWVFIDNGGWYRFSE